MEASTPAGPTPEELAAQRKRAIIVAVVGLAMCGLCGWLARSIYGPQSQSAQPPAPASIATPESACASAIAAAAAVDSMHDTVSDLDPAIRACRSLQEWTDELIAHPGAMPEGAGAALFLANRCRSTEAALGDTALCRAALGK